MRVVASATQRVLRNVPDPYSHTVKNDAAPRYCTIEVVFR